ncbi:MAG: peptidoglycan-binding protein LysM, partial [Saprospiraceae bacterium]|nr:peptidoglycan-binding protein LysM [Saprospiraceae bacterium]
MGLFSFLKNAGAKLFGKDDAPKEKSAVDQMADEVARKQKESLLKSLAEGLGIEVENLSVSYDGDTVTVWGQVESQA